MKKSKKSCGVYDYLSGLGLLSHGSDEAIIQAKKTYWATVRKEWKKIKRAQNCSRRNTAGIDIALHDHSKAVGRKQT